MIGGLNLLTVLVVWGIRQLFNFDTHWFSLNSVECHDWWMCGGGRDTVIFLVKYCAPAIVSTWLIGIFGVIKKWNAKKIIELSVMATVVLSYPAWIVMGLLFH